MEKKKHQEEICIIVEVRGGGLAEKIHIFLTNIVFHSGGGGNSPCSLLHGTGRS